MDVSGDPRRALTGMSRIAAAARRAHRAAPSPVPFLWSTLVAGVFLLTVNPAPAAGTMPLNTQPGGLVIKVSQAVQP